MSDFVMDTQAEENATKLEQPSKAEGMVPVADVRQGTSLASAAARDNETQVAMAANKPGPVRIDDFLFVEDLGNGAYGQVKLAHSKNSDKITVIKFITKKLIPINSWIRDRKLGTTVPFEIHVLNFLGQNDMRHPNIVHMEAFFEDNANYYIQMTPHGPPCRDLYHHIEQRPIILENECRSIFLQVARAVHHLHTKALIVHRDITDSNVILDGSGKAKLIDFGSAAYVKSGPFDEFAGSFEYAAPEKISGPYHGKPQDVWALGIMLYTIVYKGVPFHDMDEVIGGDLRTPYISSIGHVELVRHMLNRDVEQRYTIEQVLEHPWCGAAAHGG